MKNTIIEKIKSFEDACKELGISTDLPTFPQSAKNMQSLIAYYKLTIIIEALNEGWVADMFNYKQIKWYNWIYLLVGGAATYGSIAGFACSNSYDSPADTIAYIGSRLCFKSEELADYARSQFLDLYKTYLTE